MQIEHLTHAVMHLDHLSHNLRLLQELAGGRPMWPAIKANGYGHDAAIVARHLLALGYDTLCVAQVSEAAALIDAGIEANFLLLSAALPEQSAAIVAYGCEPAVCTLEMVQALSREAVAQGREVALHLMVDTGMGRVGIPPAAVAAFLAQCHALPRVRVRGLMSHFPCADEADKRLSHEEIRLFGKAISAAQTFGVEVCHMANSAAIFDLPSSHFDAVRPGIAIYGLAPSGSILNPHVAELKPVLEWRSRVTFLKEVPAGTGLSYGHSYHTQRPSLIATVPVGYGDGLHRNLSSDMEMLVGGRRCSQVGRITMDQSLLDVTALRGQVALGDEVMIIGRQGGEEVSADELAHKLGTINYEVVSAIAARVPRRAITGGVN